MNHFLSIRDLDRSDVPRLFALIADLKAKQKARDRVTPLAGRTMALIFEKPSLRTRVTFEVAMTQLGGAAVYLATSEIGMGTRESVPDVARNLSRWVDVVTARVFAHRTLDQLAAHASVPVINGLSDLEHPCQAVADFFTLWERGLDLAAPRAWRGWATATMSATRSSSWRPCAARRASWPRRPGSAPGRTCSRPAAPWAAA